MSQLIFKIIFRLALYGLAAYFFLSLYFFYLYIHPPRFVSGFSPADLNLKYEDITLKTQDGLSLAAWFIPCQNSSSAIIVCHGYPADKGNILGLAAFLCPKYNLLLFDFRAMGKSQGSFSTGGWNERQDFLAAVSFLKAKGFKDIGAFGFSMGGAVAIMADSPDVKAIASDSSYADLDSVLHLIFKNFGVFRYPFVWLMKLWAKLFFQIDTASVSPLKFISSTKVPVLLIHSEYDSQVPVEHVRMLRRANPRSEIWIIPESEHGRGMSSRPEEYQDRVLKFFADNKI